MNISTLKMRFLKIKNIPDLLSDDKDDKLMGNFDF